MGDPWIDMLRYQSEAKGRATVARELGVSISTISLVLANKYPASTEAIKKRVVTIYGEDGQIDCPVLGGIEPGCCVEHWERAKKIGVSCGNPATIRLHATCIHCQLRNS